MAARMRASDLLRLDLAYAPQYGTAKDPVNMLGYVAENLADGTTANIQWHEVEAARAAGATVVDVRTAAEFAAEAIPGAINLPLDELRHRLAELPPGQLIVHCQVGQRAHSAVSLLRAHGRDAVNLDGGLLTWRAGTRTRGEL
jgi:rhodanese-related sulfurtransferase